MSSKRVDSVVKDIELETADQLLQALTPPSEHLGNVEPYSWVFRGVTRKDYKLIPSALRDRSLVHYKPRFSNQIAAECAVLKEFFRFADLRGLALPEDSQRMRARLASLNVGMPKNTYAAGSVWPPTELLSLCGLAQHYGLPTRLLDWTYNPLIAAYFAAAGVMKHFWGTTHSWATTPDGENAMSVWAFNKVVDDAFRIVAQYGVPSSTKPMPYEMVTIPYAMNPNVQAQQGLFSVVRQRLDKEIDWRPLDEIVCNYLDENFDENFNNKVGPVFLRFDLPWSQSASVLKLLATLGVNGATTFPGYRGVVETVRETRWWSNLL